VGEGAIGGDRGSGGGGLLLPPVGDVVFPMRQVVEVETLARAGGVLPPEAGAVLGVGELEDAGQSESPARAGGLAGDEGGGQGLRQDGLAQNPQVFATVAPAIS
jgi:hypothetical protein